MLPEGWTASTIGEHIELLSGHAFKSEEYVSSLDGAKLLRGDNVGQGRIRWRAVKRYPQSKVSGLDRYQLQVGDFVIAMDRTWIPAGVKVAEIFEEDLPCLLVQRVARLRAKPSLRQDLLRQYFAGHRFEQFVQEVQTETAVPHISPNDIKAFEIALPPLPEQRKIAEILSTWDRAIAAQERLIANARAQKKALMQTLLPTNTHPPKKRLPGFSGTWVRMTLKDIATITYGASPKGISINHGANPIIGTGGVVGRTDQRTDDGPAIIIGRKGTIDEPQLVDSPFWAIDTTYFCKPKIGHDLIWLYYNLQLLDFRALNEASGVPSLSRETLYSVSLSAPKLPEQRRIGQAIQQADAYAAVQVQQLTTLRQEKSALMQQLLTGKRRVKAGEVAA
jgi:type I restriction enzyme S subunit